MSFRKLVVLLLILATLLGASVVKKMQQEKARGTGNSDIIKTESSLGQDVAPGFVTKISIRRGLGTEDSLTLAKDDAKGWRLASRFGALVRQSSVDAFLKNLSALRGEARAENLTVLEDFELTDEKALHLILYAAGDKELIHLLLSPLRPRGTQNFIRLAGSAKVLATSTDILGDLGIYEKGTKLDYHVFADFRVAGIDSSKISSFELTPEGGQVLHFVKKEEGGMTWSLTEDASFVVSAPKVNEFLSGVYNLYANDALDPVANAASFTAKEPWLRLHLKDGEKEAPIEIWAGARSAEKKTLLLKSVPDGIVYEIQESQADTALKKTKDFFLQPKGA